MSDLRFDSKDDFLGLCRVRGWHAPVNVSAILNVRVMSRLSRHVENLMDKLFAVIWLLEVQLHSSGEQRKLHAIRLLEEILAKLLEERLGVVNFVGILSDDPVDGRFGLWLCVVL